MLFVPPLGVVGVLGLLVMAVFWRGLELRGILEPQVAT